MLEVRNLSVRYDRAIVAVSNIGIKLPDSSFTALLGANGAGKTTLLKAIAGQLAHDRGEISEGSVWLNEERIDRAGPLRTSRSRICLVQEGRQCFRNLTVGENLKAASVAKGFKHEPEAAFVYFPDLRTHIDRPAGLLSGGQLQMLVLAMALLQKPRILLLDEPSLGLAPVVVDAVFDAIEAIHRNYRTTIVVAEQTVPRLLKIASHVIALRNGVVVIDRSISEVDPSALESAYLG